MRLHISNPGYDIDDASCPLKNNGILFHKSKKLKLIHVKTKAVYKIYKGGEHY